MAPGRRLQNQQRTRIARTGRKFAETGVKRCLLSAVTVRQKQELHIRDLVRADRAGPLRIAQIPQIDIHWPVLVAWALAVLFKVGQRPSDGIARSSQCTAGCAKKSGLG